MRPDPIALGPTDLAWRGGDLLMTTYRPTAQEPFGLQALRLVADSWQAGPVTTGIAVRGPGPVTTQLAISDDWALVGAPSSPVAGSQAGAATFVRWDADAVAELRPVVLDEGHLGGSLAVRGAQIVSTGPSAGAYGGSLVWFEQDAGGQYRSRPSLTAGDTRFGEAAAVDVRHAMVSSVGPQFGVQTFELGDRDWTAGAYLTAPDAGRAGFGSAIALDGDTAVVAVSGQPVAYVYRWSLAAGWSLAATLAAPTSACASAQVSLSGARILLRCASSDQLWLFQGGVQGWLPMAAPSLPEPVTSDGVIRAYLSGDRIAVSALAQSDHHGVSYVFRRLGDSWQLELARRTDAPVTVASGCSAGCGFGVLALAGDRLILAHAGGAVTGFRAGDAGWLEDRTFVLPPGERPVDTVVQLVGLTDDRVVVAVPDEAGRDLLGAGALYVFPWR